jgi:hypothetical protein
VGAAAGRTASHAAAAVAATRQPISVNRPENRRRADRSGKVDNTRNRAATSGGVAGTCTAASRACTPQIAAQSRQVRACVSALLRSASLRFLMLPVSTMREIS